MAGIVTTVGERARDAPRIVSLAERLPVEVQEQVRFLHGPRRRRQGLRRLARGCVSPRVRLVLANEAEPDEDTQAVGFRRKQRPPLATIKV